MRFEVSETITTGANKEIVYKTLYTQFKKASESVGKYEGYFIAKKIEGSFGSINRNDKSVVTIKEKNNGYLLVADVNYIPSFLFWVFLILLLFTYIGWVLPIIFYLYQKNTVRDGIQNIFMRVKNEFQDIGNKETSVNKPDSLEQLEKLYSLKEKGIITEDEYQLKKSEYLKQNL